MTRHMTAKIIVLIAAMVLTLSYNSSAEDDDYYYGVDDDRIALSEERATQVAEQAVERLIKDSRAKMASLLRTTTQETEPASAYEEYEEYEEEEEYNAEPAVEEYSSRGPASNIVSIVNNPTRGGTTLTISGDGDIGEYTSFALNDPTRLVVDIAGVGSTLSSRTLTINIGSRLVDKVRVGAHPGKVRLVFDSSLNDMPEYSFSRVSGDLLITFGQDSSEAEKEELRRRNSRKGTKKKTSKKKTVERVDVLKAITVCAIDAPEMTKDFTDRTGYRLQRVSLKVRNPDNTADYYEREILKDFEDMKNNGTLKKSTVHKRVVYQDSGKYLRYMKPIVVSTPCLNCHGHPSNIQTDVRRFIKRFYPDDEATGYKLGDVRGAISVKIPVKMPTPAPAE